MIEIVRCDFRELLARDDLRGAVDLVVTSPPYANARTYGAGVSFSDLDYQELGSGLFEILRSGGHALVNVDAPIREWRPGLGTERGLHPWRLAIDWSDRVGFRMVERLAYQRFGSPGEYRGRFRNDFEPLLWFQKPGGETTFDKWAIAERCEPYAGISVTSRERDGSTRKQKQAGRAAVEGWKHRGTVWQYGNVGSKTDAEHPAAMAADLARDLVRCFSAPGDLVLDPFVGSGTTAIAALELGRRFVGGDSGERDSGEPWAEYALRKARASVAQQTLFPRGSL